MSHSRRSWAVARIFPAVVVIANCSAPQKPTATGAPNATGKVPRTLAGATLGSAEGSLPLSPDPHPPDALVPIRGVTWYVPAEQQKIGDVMPTETHFQFASKKLASILLKFTGDEACGHVREALESQYGAPTTSGGGKTMMVLSWLDGVISLSFTVIQWEGSPNAGGCSISLEDDAAEMQAIGEQPKAPQANHVDHFGEVKLGAKKSTFSGLKLRDKAGTTVWYVPPSLTYRGVAMKSMTYAFDHGETLVNVGFDVKKFDDCPRLLLMFKDEYGAFEQHSNVSGGTSYDWVSPGGHLTYNIFTSTCTGIIRVE